MSVSAELARLRLAGQQTNQRNPGPSLLTTSAEAARLPRSEAAGVALNALDLLAHADPSLPLFAGPLLLTDPRRDRATLDADTEKELATAVCRLARRTAPVFVLRPVQKILEWNVRCLNVGMLGSDGEVDALMLAALPFHETKEFALLVRALLYGGTARRAAWSGWLAPVLKQGKGVTKEFVIAEAPMGVFRMAVLGLVDSATEGVLNCPLAGFVAGTVGRVIAGEGGRGEVENRRLVAEVLIGVEKIRMMLETGRSREAGSTGKGDCVRAIGEALSALLVALGAGALAMQSVGDIVRLATAKVAVGVGVAAPQRMAAFGVLVSSVIAKEEGGGVMEAEVFEVFRNCEADTFSKLVQDFSAFDSLDLSLIRPVVLAFGRAAISAAERSGFSEGSLNIIVNLFGLSGPVLDTELTAGLVERLLLSTAALESGGEADKGISTAVAGVISPLARGRLSGGVDEGVRKFFDVRQNGAKSTIVESALEQALHNTPYALVKAAVQDRDRKVLKENMGSESSLNDGVFRSVGTLSASLDHPEAEVRLVAVTRVAESITQRDEANMEGLRGDRKDLGAALLRRISVDSDLRVVLAALSCPAVLYLCDAEHVVDAVGRRLLNIQAASTAPKGKMVVKLTAGACKLLMHVVESVDNSQATGSCVRRRVNGLVVSLVVLNEPVMDSPKVLKALSKLLKKLGGLVGTVLLPAVQERSERVKHPPKADQQEGLVLTKPGEAKKKQYRRKGGGTSVESGDATLSVFTHVLSSTNDDEELSCLFLDAYRWSPASVLPVICSRLSADCTKRVETSFVLTFLKAILGSDSHTSGPLGDAQKLKLLVSAVDGLCIGADFQWGEEMISALALILDHAVELSDAAIVCRVLGAVVRASDSEQTWKFLHHRLFCADSVDGRIVAFELLSIMCISGIYPVSFWVDSFVAVAFGECDRLYKAALGTARLVCQRYVAREGSMTDIDSRLIFGGLRGILESRSPRKSHPGLTTKWRGREWPTLAMSDAQKNGDPRSTLNCKEGEPLATMLLKNMELACMRDDWGSSLAHLKACRVLLGSDRGALERDSEIVKTLLGRYTQVSQSRVGSNAMDARQSVALAMYRLLHQDRCRLLPGEKRMELVSVIGGALSICTGAIAEISLCLLAELVLSEPSVGSNVASHVKYSPNTSVLPLQAKVMRVMLRSSSRATSEGDFASFLLTSFGPLLPPCECQLVLGALAEQISGDASPAKRVRRDPGEQAVDDENDSRVLGVAALEALSRFSAQSDASGNEMPLALSTAAAPGLWALVRRVDDICRTNSFSIVPESVEYQLQLALRVLRTVVRRDTLAFQAGDKSCELHISADEVDAAVNAVSYPGWDYTGEVASMHSAIQDAAISLVEALAPHPGAVVRGSILPVIEKLVRSRVRRGVVAVLTTMLPPLVGKGLKASEFVPQLAKSVYGPSSMPHGRIGPELRGTVDGIHRHELVACAIRACSDRVEALVLAVDTLSDMVIPKFAAVARSITSRCQLSVDDELSFIARTRKDCVPRLVVELLTSPDFLERLETGVTESSSSKKVELALEYLFNSLVGAEGDDSLCADALGVMLGALPLALLPRCVKLALNSGDGQHTLQALNVLSRSITWSNVLAGTKGRSRSGDKAVIVRELCEILMEIVEKRVGNDSTGEQCGATHAGKVSSMSPSIAVLRQGAVCALEKLNLSMGACNKECIMSCAKRIALCVEEESLQAAVVNPLDRGNRELSLLAGNMMLYLSSVVDNVGAMAATLVPGLVNTSLHMMESALRADTNGSTRSEPTSGFEERAEPGDDSGADNMESGSDMSAENDTSAKGDQESEVDQQSMSEVGEEGPDMAMVIAETGVRVCQTVLANIPSFFGESAIRRIAALAVEVDFRVLEDLLVQAVSVVKPSHVVASLSFALDSANGLVSPSRGHIVVMRVLSEAVCTMRKNAVKESREDLFSLCLRGLNFRSLAHEHRWPPLEVGEVERAASDALVGLVLRIPETEFRPLFNKFIDWMESATLDEMHGTVNKEQSLDVANNVFRAIPFFVAIGALFESLRVLMLPFFALVLDRSLQSARLSCKVLNPATSGSLSRVGKRKRDGQTDVEDLARSLVGSQRHLIHKSLSCLSHFVRHLSPASTPNARTLVSRVMESLLAAFDQASSRDDYSVVNDVVSAVASKIVAIGSDSESREDSRQLLCALSRGILLRARAKDSDVRAAACESARLVAVAAGDEILVALPEAMPVLADVIDDENATVEDAARDLVKTLETLSGEPILEQLS